MKKGEFCRVERGGSRLACGRGGKILLVGGGDFK